MEKEIQKLAEKVIKNKLFPACVVGVVKINGNRLIIPAGNFTYDKNSPVVKKDSIFDVASITKSIPVSSLALKFIDKKKLSLNDKVIKYIPELNNRQKDKLLVKHLLSQTVEYNFHLSDFKQKSPQEILNIIFTTDFKGIPGKNLTYANASSILLGIILERISKKSLNKLSEQYFLKPLKMTRTLFRPLEKINKNEIVPTEFQPWRKGLIQGKIHDESAYILNKIMIPGSAGLFSTVPDLLNFLEMLLNKGSLNGKKYFSSYIINQIQTNQINNKDFTGLGWELNQPQYMGKYCAKNTFGKTGFTGCCCICDIKKGAAIVILTNYTYPKRKPNSKKLNIFRRAIADIVFNR